MNTIAVYPGSFDPITNGHLDIVARAAAVFDTVIVAVLANPRKAPLLAVEDRIRVIGEALTDAGHASDRFEIVAFDGLTVDLCRTGRGATAIVRGLRAHQRLRDRDAARPQQPGPGPRRGHRLLHDLGRQRLRELEPGQGDRGLRRRRLGDGAGDRRAGAPRGVRQALTARLHACIAASLRPSRGSLEGTPIDIIFLVERLESLIANGKKLPLTTNVVVDQNAALGLIDELRVAVPEEVRAAKRINSEGERIIEKAQEEAERIVAKAQEQAAFLIDERGLTQAADLQSREIIATADHDADAIRRGADEYAVSVLVGLEGDVVKTLQSIKNGIALLGDRRSSLGTDGAGSDDRDGDERWEDETAESSTRPR